MAGRKPEADAPSSPAERTWFTAHPVTLTGIEPFRPFPRNFQNRPVSVIPVIQQRPLFSPLHAYPSDSDSDRDVIKVKTHYQYVNSGSASGFYTTTSNPYKATVTTGWSRTRQDRLGRVVEVAAFGGATRPSGPRHAQLGQDHDRL